MVTIRGASNHDQGYKVKNMSPEAIRLTEILLEHHRTVCRPGRLIESCLITYGPLCEKAGVPYLTQSVGIFLREVAEWCQIRNLPPINALAVNQATRMPGAGYDLAPGCSALLWPNEVRTCIDCMTYPTDVLS
jgi:hypothetical protein